MPDKYKNNKGVYIDVNTDKRGKDHISIYDKDPKDPDHSSIHINWDSNTGKGSITDTTNGSKETTDTSCYLTSACMKHYLDKFDNTCYELQTLRWFRDTFVTQEDIAHYYQTAPMIVSEIDKQDDSNNIYKDIYQKVISVCVSAIEQKNYGLAYQIYKENILKLEEQFGRPALQKRLVKALNGARVLGYSN